MWQKKRRSGWLYGDINHFGGSGCHNIAVKAEYRRCGIAEALIYRMVQDCRERGIQAMTLEVRVGNEPAIQLYRKMGFCSVGIRKNFYQKPTEDAIIMWKYQL